MWFNVRVPSRCGLLAVVLFGAGIARPAAAQTVATMELGSRTGRTPFAFGAIGSVGELRDGRVVVADSRNRVYRIVDFAGNQMPVLGEPGDDPLQYRAAGQVMRWKADSLLLYVGMRDQARYLHVSPTGEIVASTAGGSPAPPTLPENGGYSISQPYGVDRDGAAYFLLSLTDSTFTPYELADVMKFSADGNHRTIVDYLRTRRKSQVYPHEPGTVVPLRPFDFADAWALRTDGLAARVVSDTYEVVWSRDGKETGRTGPLPFTPIPLNAAEQTAFRDSMIERFNPKPAADGGKAPSPAAGGGAVARMGGGGVTTGDNNPRTFTPPPAATTLKIPNIAPYQDRKPAIPNPRWQRVALFDLAGRLWVVRERAHGDDVPHIDIIEEGRGVVGHVNLPKHTLLGGFGANSVYLIMRDENGDWLERYPLPKL